jgi:hypothetical protein
MPAGVSAYTALGNLTLSSSSVQEVNFTSISQSYRDLVCIFTVTSSAGSGAINQNTFNGDNSGQYRFLAMQAAANLESAQSQETSWYLSYPSTNLLTTAPTTAIIQIPDYSANYKKVIYWRADNVNAATTFGYIFYFPTAAITQFRIRANTTFAAGSTFSLYGVSA